MEQICRKKMHWDAEQMVPLGTCLLSPDIVMLVDKDVMILGSIWMKFFSLSLFFRTYCINVHLQTLIVLLY